MAASIAKQRLIKLLAIGNQHLQKNRAGFGDDDYRAILQQCGARKIDGRISATTMTVPDMERALSRLKLLGFVPKKPKAEVSKISEWRAPRIAKLNALWIAMAAAGRIQDGSQKAMENWCRSSIPGFTRLQWATSKQLNTAIEMLKKFSAR